MVLIFRFTRGINTLKELHNKARSGRVVDEAEIPPAVSIGVASGITKPSATPVDDSFRSAPVTDDGESFSLPHPQPHLPEPMRPTLVSTGLDLQPPTPPPRPQPRKLPQPPEPVDYERKTKTIVPTEPDVDYEMTNADLPQVNGAFHVFDCHYLILFTLSLLLTVN